MCVFCERLKTSDTLVYTKEGYVPIQNIRAGDDIYSREETTGETGFQKVEEVFLRSVHTIYTIEVNTTTKIQTTSRHPFYVEGEGWVIANQLQVGMNLQTMNGAAVITNLKKERTDEVIPVYNFRVSGWSSYFVSEWNVYVHNAKKGQYKGDPRTEVNWTNHGHKHFPDKNKSWKDIVKSTKSGPAKYSKDISNIEAFEREAWETGISTTNGKNWKVKAYDKVIGATGGKETRYIRIENSANTIHGHPISESEYLKLLR